MLSSTTPIHINLQKIKRNRRTKKYKKKTNPKNKMCLLPASQFKLHLYLSQPVKTRVSSEYRSLPNVLIQTSMYKKQLQNFIFKFLPKSHFSWSRRKKKRKRKDEQAGVQEWLRAFWSCMSKYFSGLVVFVHSFISVPGLKCWLV